jgi:HEAT repeat protein
MERLFNAVSADSRESESLLSLLPDDLILEALEAHTSQEFYVPPNILDVLQRLAKASQNPESTEEDGSLSLHSQDEILEKLKVIFKEDEIDRFVPLDYGRILREIVVSNDLSLQDVAEVQQLEQTLADHSVNMGVTSIIIDILAAGNGYQLSDSILRSLRDRCSFLIERGDFDVVLRVFDKISQNTGRWQTGGVAPPDIFAAVFSDDGLRDELLKAPGRWGKERHFPLTELIKRIGEPLVGVLLDRLAEEGNRALRQFYLDSLKELGDTVRDEAVKRLTDSRWYVVRNLLIILRQVNDPSVSSSLHPLLDHPHPKVRHELLHTLLLFKDPEANRMLLEEMDSHDTERLMKAITLSAMTRNGEVTERLTQFLKQDGLDDKNLGIKRASVRALAELRDPSVLPLLQTILKSQSFFARNKLHSLKLEIIESLGRYPTTEVSSVLQNIVCSRSRELAFKASAVMGTLRIGQA